MTPDAAQALDQLLALMARLRAPGGCPWDREQTFLSLTPYTIEEAYEVVEAAESGDISSLREELGDLLFHVVFYSQIASELGHFTMADVTEAVTAKMTRRHPHVFGDLEAHTAEDVVHHWEEIKKKEKSEKKGTPPTSLLHGISGQLPALMWAYKIQKKMAKAGFDWPDAVSVLEKVHEELTELVQAQSRDQDAMEEEFGDLLFTLVNVARHLSIQPETALRRATRKCRQRFLFMEHALGQQGRKVEETPLDELEQLWLDSKKAGL